MFLLVFIVCCIVLYGVGRIIYRAGPPHEATRRPALNRPRGAVHQAETLSFPDRVQDRWTALDDRQLTRLLDDSAPC